MDTCKKINLQLAIRFLCFTFIKWDNLGRLHKKLLKLIKKNGGMITYSQVTNADIPRTYLLSMEQKGKLVRV